MTVYELMEILENSDPDAVVLLSSDEEGNSYRIANVEIGDYALNDGYEISVAHPDDIDSGEYDPEVFFPVVVIW